jgi:hypothetical protein
MKKPGVCRAFLFIIYETLALAGDLERFMLKVLVDNGVCASD